MMTQQVADLTLDELNHLIEQVVDDRLQALLKPRLARTMVEIDASVQLNRITLPMGSKSSLEFLREDRDA